LWKHDRPAYSLRCHRRAASDDLDAPIRKGFSMLVTQAAGIYRRYQSSSVNQQIHPNDVMYNTGKPFYHSVGESGLRAILNALSASSCSGVSCILDLPCGHGRVGRHLRAAFPDAQMYFCDIDSEAADFCANTFGGKSIHSQPDLTKVSLPGDLDLIWIGSLFTHLDKSRTEAWLEYLCGQLCEHGVLVATFHGLFTAEHRSPGGGADREAALRGMRESGFGYARYTEFGEDDYGFSVAKPAAILDMATRIRGTRVVSYVERGWANNHDVLAIAKRDRLLPFKA
jgi:hypothetical protein